MSKIVKPLGYSPRERPILTRFPLILPDSRCYSPFSTLLNPNVIPIGRRDSCQKGVKQVKRSGKGRTNSETGIISGNRKRL